MKYKNFEGSVDNLVQIKLAEIEKIHNIRIVYAVESGSRAWGFASPDSDYDVRFIYLRSKNEYLSLEPQRDYVDGVLDDILDINGWDLRKFLQQMHRSNASVFEWIHSPIQYKEDKMINEIRSISNHYFFPKPFLHHYFGTAKNNYLSYLNRDYVKYKKYFYVLRPLLACQWIVSENTVPPVLFQSLLDHFDMPDIKNAIHDLQLKKIKMTEAEEGPICPIVHGFIKEQLAWYESYISSLENAKCNDWNELNNLFLKFIS